MARKNPRIYTYTVTGKGSFPLDMLRYDVASPADAKSAALIEARPSRPPGLVGYPEIFRYSVRLVSAFKPTLGRWESFGWEVSDVSSARTAKNNPRSTGYVAAKIRANTASRKPQRTWLLPQSIEFGHADEAGCATVEEMPLKKMGHGRTGPNAIYKHPRRGPGGSSHVFGVSGPQIFVGDSYDYGPMVVAFWDDEHGGLVDASVVEYASLPVALAALASGAWYHEMPDWLIGPGGPARSG